MADFYFSRHRLTFTPLGGTPVVLLEPGELCAADRHQIDDLNAEVQKLRQEGDAIEQTQGQAAPDAAQAEQDVTTDPVPSPCGGGGRG